MKCKKCGSKLVLSKTSKKRVVYVNCPKCGRIDAFLMPELSKMHKYRLR